MLVDFFLQLQETFNVVCASERVEDYTISTWKLIRKYSDLFNYK